MLEHKLGFIGAGSIAEAILKGILSHKLFEPENIYVINRKNDERLEYLREKYGINTMRDYEYMVSRCDILVIAVKPKDVRSLLDSLGAKVTEDHIIITVAAGITTAFIEERLPKKVQVVRAMPNTSCQVKESATAISPGKFVRQASLKLVSDIFSSVGMVAEVGEDKLDAVTGLSGSGPAYVYFLMEAMIEGGIQSGLSEKLSRELTVQTVLGAAKMIMETGESPGVLRRRVSTPGGTTMAGIEILEAMNFSQSIIRAVDNASQRSREMMLENQAKSR